MGVIGSTAIPTSITASFSDSNTEVTIFNIILPSANTEYTQALPPDTKAFILKARGLAPMNLAYTSGDTGALYVSVPAGTTYEDIHFYASQSLYFQSSTAGVTLELVAYSKL